MFERCYGVLMQADRTRWHLITILVVAWLAIFAGLGRGTFWEPDEPRFAEATHQMFQRGDFFTPYLNGVPRFEKPILFYWAQAVAFIAFGENEFAARVPSAVAGIGIVILLYLLAAQVASPRAALVSALVLSTMFRFVTFARIGLTDVPVLFFIVAALYGFVCAAARASWRWVLFAWSCVGLGVLTKGPVGLLPVVIWLTYAVLIRSRSTLTRVRPLLGMALAIAIAAPWYVLMIVEYGRAFIDFALGHEIFERVVSEASFAPSRGFFYYFKVWPGDAAPWSAMFIAAVGWAVWRWRALDQTAKRSLILASAWFISVFIVFSLSRSKVPHYVLPAYPAAAFFIGVFVDRLAEARSGVLWWGVPMSVVAAASVILAAAAGLFLDVLAPGDTIVKWLVPGVLGAGAAAIAYAIWNRALVPAVYALTCMLAIVFAVIGVFIVPRVIEPFKPMPLLAREIGDLSPPGAPIGLVGAYGRSSLIYYSQRNVLFLDGDDTAVRFLSTPGAVCVMPASEYERLAPRLTGVAILARAEEFNVRVERLLERRKTPGRLWVLVGPRSGRTKS